MQGWQVRAATHADWNDWARLRQTLWPQDSLAAQIADIQDTLNGDAQGFIAHDAQGQAIGFAEASVRRDYVNGTETSPVAFLEGWYVAPEWRGRGVGRALIDAVERWSREQECEELASDAALDNTGSHAAHAACGFEETERVVYFRKALE